MCTARGYYTPLHVRTYRLKLLQAPSLTRLRQLRFPTASPSVRRGLAVLSSRWMVAAHSTAPLIT